MAFSLFLLFAAAAAAYADSGPGGAGYENGEVGGAYPGHTNSPSTGGGTTDVWAGVSVDYMFPLRYEVTDADGSPLAEVSIEHYDYNGEKYIFVGRTDETGVWVTEVPPSYWMHNIMGQGEASIVDTSNIYSGEGRLRHRVSKEGYQLEEGLADVSVENPGGKATGVVRITLARAPESGDPGGSGGAIPQTGVQSHWLYFAAGGLLFLLAALILWRALRAQGRANEETQEGEQK